MIKRICEALLAFNAGACIAAFVLANMWDNTSLFGCAVIFGMSAFAFAVGLKAASHVHH